MLYAIVAGSAAPSLILAGTPTANAPLGTKVPPSTTAPAATKEPVSTIALCRTSEPEPTNAPFCTVHPSKCALCPTVHSSPIIVGSSAVQCMTQPSWIEVRAPISIRLESPRKTAHGPMKDSSPTDTSPIMTASGCTNALGWMFGTLSPNE